MPETNLDVAQSIHKSMFVLMALTKDLTPAVFSSYDPETGDIYYYFSPGAELVAQAHKASPCEPPSKTEAGSLFNGQGSAIAHFFG